MIELKDKNTIIKLKEKGHSDRKIAKLTGFNRKTVAKHWNRHQTLVSELTTNGDLRRLQEEIVSKPKYDAGTRGPRKYTAEIDTLIDLILAEETVKDAALGGSHKQKLTNVQIHERIKSAGHDIGLTVVSEHIKRKRDWIREAYIRQTYDFGQRLEFDFGEVKLEIRGMIHTYHLAVFSSPRAEFRWAYLYRSQKKDVFLDSHVRLFEMSGGAYEEVVYDNMKNVVTKFIGRSEKQLNEDLVKMSIYYGFRINVTNCFSGNEKGHVEGSVKFIRNKVFAARYKFDSFEEAEEYMNDELVKMNSASSFEEECMQLLPYRPPLELAQISEQKVDKYSFVRVENNFYSVPDYLVGREVVIKNYQSEIVVYSAGNKVCSHKKKEGFHKMTVEIVHYLDTFMRKPGALKNSLALKCKEDLKNIFDNHYTGREKEFIEVLKNNQDKEISAIASLLMESANPMQDTPSKTIEDNVTSRTKSQLSEITRLFMSKGGEKHVN